MSMSFADWIKKYEGEASPVGDLARDILRDGRFPKNSKDKRRIKEYLWSRGACSECLTAFNTAWQLYSDYLDSEE